MQVRELMRTDVVTAGHGTSVGEVARLMLTANLDGIPVVDADGQLLGLVTARDIVSKHAHPHVPFFLGILGGVVAIEPPGSEKELERILAVTAGEIMTHKPYTIAPDQTIEDAADMMVEEDADPIPVVEEGRLVGLLGHDDILRLVMTEESDESGI